MARLIPVIHDWILETKCYMEEPSSEERSYHKKNGNLLFTYCSSYLLRYDGYSVSHHGKLIWYLNGIMEFSTSIPLEDGAEPRNILRGVSEMDDNVYYDKETNSIIWTKSLMAYTYELRPETIKAYIHDALITAQCAVEDHSWLSDVCCKIISANPEEEIE